MAFPATRLRRLRKTGVLRDMVRETELTPSHLVQPLFVQLGEGRTPVESMPGVERLSISNAVEEAGHVHELGGPATCTGGGCRPCCCSASPPTRTRRARAPTTTRAWSSSRSEIGRAS